MEENNEVKKVKKNNSFKTAGLLCFIGAVVWFFISTFIKVVLGIMSKGGNGESMKKIIDFLSPVNTFIVILLILIAIILLICSAFDKNK